MSAQAVEPGSGPAGLGDERDQSGRRGAATERHDLAEFGGILGVVAAPPQR